MDELLQNTIIPLAKSLLDIITHPSTPQYCQAAVILFTALWGGRKVVSYIEQKQKEKAFDLAIKSYTLCKKSSDILLSITSNQYMTRLLFDNILSSSRKKFANIVAEYATSDLKILADHAEVFNEMYTTHCEIHILKGKIYSEPLLGILSIHSKIVGLLQSIITTDKIFGEQLDNGLAYSREIALNTIDDAMVQVWNNIDLSQRQKDQEAIWAEEIKKENKVGYKKFKYLNEKIALNMANAETRYQQLVSTPKK